MKRKLFIICSTICIVIIGSIAFAWERAMTENGNIVYAMRNYPHYFVLYSGFESGIISAIHNACSTWNNAGVGNLVFRLTSQTHNFLSTSSQDYYDEDNVNTFTKGERNEEWYAECHSFAKRKIGDAVYRIEENDIHLNTDIPMGDFSINEDLIDVEALALHELGHAIGLGHSLDIGAVMFPIVASQRYLATDDIQGINAIY